MDKSIKNIYIPKLRFKGFDNNEIIFKNLDEIFLIKNGYTPSKRNKLFWENGNIPWFRIDDIRINGQILEDSLIKTTNIAINKKNLFKKNSIILSTTATVGIHALIKTDFLCNQQLTSFQIKDEFNISHLFSFYHFYKISNWCKKNIRSTSFPCIEIKDLKKQLFWIPTIEEQNKIAKFFSLIDQQISLLENKLQLIEQKLKYFINKLLKTYNGFPKIRFKEFNDIWMNDYIKNIFTITRGLVIAKNKIIKESNEKFCYPVYSSQTENDGLMGYYNEYLYQNAITWTTDGAKAGTVNYRNQKFYCSNVCGVLLEKEYKPNLCFSLIIQRESKKYVVRDLGNPKLMNNITVSYTHLTLPTTVGPCRSRWSPYH